MSAPPSPDASLAVHMTVVQGSRDDTRLLTVALGTGMVTAMVSLLLVIGDPDAPLDSVGTALFLGGLLLTFVLGLGTSVLVGVLWSWIRRTRRRRQGIPRAFSSLDVPVLIGPAGLDIKGLGVVPWAEITDITEGPDENGTILATCKGPYDLMLTVSYRDLSRTHDVVALIQRYTRHHVPAQA
ncbi:hypothetical protein [Deinococcus sp. QL22]|uniref:hypothetical protein n=1 Tax=Deinococcus sp. QL22 TaxID=2939437 RepID=UPI002017F2BA|nr:hypothetical protein [Deinococcus sp. QL22]UQN08421.1 hypothetical protein M1R55_16995 [Deinococcus sp. QL22]